METIQNENTPRRILVDGEFFPTNTNSSVDGREKVSTLNDIYNIPNPKVGLRVYVVDEGKWYTITALTSKVMGGITVPNSAVSAFVLDSTASRFMTFDPQSNKLSIF